MVRQQNIKYRYHKTKHKKFILNIHDEDSTDDEVCMHDTIYENDDFTLGINSPPTQSTGHTSTAPRVIDHSVSSPVVSAIESLFYLLISNCFITFLISPSFLLLSYVFANLRFALNVIVSWTVKHPINESNCSTYPKQRL